MPGSIAAVKRPSDRKDETGSSGRAGPPADQDSQMGFRSEEAMEAQLRASFRRRNSPLIGFAALTAIIAGMAGVYFLRSQSDPIPTAPPVVKAPAPPAVKTSDVIIDSRPDGAEVRVDGTLKGLTPLRMALPVGPHILELRNGASIRSIPLAVELGKVISQYIELPETDAAPISSSATGRLEVTSEPNGATVNVDGTPRGVTPLVLPAVAPGPHQIVIGNGDGAVTRNVRISAGTTATVVASVALAGSAAGWASIRSPIDLQILENGKLIGTTSAERVMVPVGRHNLELVNDTYGFRTSVTVQIAAGQTVTNTLTMPNGSLSINALPWADVIIDGKAQGTTPLGNLSVPIGSHEIVWRHPTLGERKQTVVVTARTPVRVAVDFGK
jgi:hypothetical protein